MRYIFLCIFFFAAANNFAQQLSLTVWNKSLNKQYNDDWLVKSIVQKAAVYKSEDGKDIILCNGLLKRVFRISPNVACTDFTNMTNGQQLLRAVKPEARVTIDNTGYNVGGLHGQKENAYLLTNWVNDFTDDKNDFHLTAITTDTIKPRFSIFRRYSPW